MFRSTLGIRLGLPERAHSWARQRLLFPQTRAQPTQQRSKQQQQQTTRRRTNNRLPTTTTTSYEYELHTNKIQTRKQTKMVQFRNILPLTGPVQRSKRRTSVLPCEEDGDNSHNNDGGRTMSSSKQQRNLLSRKTALFLAIPILWVLHKTASSPKDTGRRRVEEPRVATTKKGNSRRAIIGIADLADLAPIQDVYTNHSLQHADWDTAVVDRQAIVQHLEQAGVEIQLDVLKLLPTQSAVHDLYGSEPVILGMERCAVFRAAHKPATRYVGIAGQHNCGTNAMVRYLQNNLAIPGNSREGFLPQVPWHKHGWESLRYQYNFSFPSEHDSVLPVVIVRDPYFWMHSMCESPYLMKWEHSDKNCPNLLKSSGQGNPAQTRWGTFPRKWDSLAHVWSDFYREYEQVDYPRLIIRFEDVIFHTEEVVDRIRECAGAEWKHKHFIHDPSAVKKSKYFTDIKPQSSLLSAVIKYGQDRNMRLKQMTKEEQAFAFEHLDAHLMETLHYTHPSTNAGG